jgi:hypothetical protein
MVQSLEFDVMVSYSRDDIDAVKQLVKRLYESGLRVWIDKELIKNGDKWQRRIEDGIRRSGCVLYVGSANCNASEYTRSELTFARNQDKQVFVVFLHGDPRFDLPFILSDTHYTDLRGDHLMKGLDTVIQDMRAYLRELNAAHAAVRSPTLTPLGQPPPTAISVPPDSSLIVHPSASRQFVDFVTMRLILHTLDAARSVLPSSKRRSRASLLRVHKNDLYIAAATDDFVEKELHESFHKGQGIPGMAWAHDQRDVQHIYSRDIDPAVMRRWDFSGERLHRTLEFNTAIVAPMAAGVSGPFAGMLLVESPDYIPPSDLHEPLRLIAGIRATLERMIGAARMLSCRQYRNLTTLSNAARLNPPPDVSVRSAIYVPEPAGDHLYMLVGSEHFAHDPASIPEASFRHPYGRGLIGQVWSTGAVLLDNWGDKPPNYLRNRYGLTHENDWGRNIGSIIAFPIRSRRQEVIGVLALDSPSAIRFSGFGVDTTQTYLDLLSSSIGQYLSLDES